MEENQNIENEIDLNKPETVKVDDPQKVISSISRVQRKGKLYEKVLKPIKELSDPNNEPKTIGGKILKTIWSYIIITVGTLFVAAGVYFFKFPNHFTVGGVSSLSVVLSHYFPNFSESQFMAIANVVLLIVALIIFGKQFAIKTIYSTILLSVASLVWEKVQLLERITGQYAAQQTAIEGTPAYDHAFNEGLWTLTSNMGEGGEPFLELLFTIGGIAIGSAILFSQNASSGGTDVIAMILKKFTNVNIGTALLITDVVLAVMGGFAFGVKIALFSLCGLVIKSFIVDTVIDGINLNKCFIVVTDKDEELCAFINNHLHRGATVSVCRGSFTHDDKKMIITVLSRQQAATLKKHLRQNDPQAFTIITNSTDILGKGFRIV
ncbi:MAG: YitT family protein [Clostridia bacterium]|nr:YitT family protein [Clostridia bacterium]MBQ7907816.1 YitT family protein [Clostridia bacterium]